MEKGSPRVRELYFSNPLTTASPQSLRRRGWETAAKSHRFVRASVTTAACAHAVPASRATVRPDWHARNVPDPRIQKWTTWIDKDLRADLQVTHLRRFAWQEVAKLIADNEDLPESYWWEFMVDTYATTQAVAIRRQADSRKDVISFARLLVDVREGADAITREFWVDTLNEPEDEHDRTLAMSVWDEHFGGGARFDPTIPKRDLATLIAAAEKVKKYVDCNIAHASGDPVVRQTALNVGEVHKAMDVLAELFYRYYTLLTGTTLATLTPILQHDMFGVFRQPWMREGYTTSFGPFYRG